ncbi:MAG: hypothetical protein EPN22_06260 [Nitrospirae bacterium]|nr:MAG: hypothetical protein EPN22_06260 [Nitrospirota bacterium]
MEIRNCLKIIVPALSLCLSVTAYAAEQKGDKLDEIKDKFFKPLLYNLNLDDPFVEVFEKYQEMANEAEKNAEFVKALQCWQIVSGFVPNDTETTQKVRELKAKIKKLAESHFDKGVNFYRNKSFNEARKAFLAALLYNPAHREALDYLQGKVEEENFRYFEIKRTATLQEVAEQAYSDPDKDFLIAFFNNVDVNAKLEPGTLLRVPITGSEPKQMANIEVAKLGAAKSEKDVTVNVKEMISKAIAFVNARKYGEALGLAYQIMNYNVEKDVKNDFYYQVGVALVKDEKYSESLKLFSLIDAGYRDVSGYISSVKKIVKGKAEDSYKKGVNFYINNNYQKAVSEWEYTLEIDPTHKKAKEDIEKARELLKKLKDI